MKKKIIFSSLFIFLFIFINFSGCIDNLFDIPIIYEDHPIKLSYTITYGYDVVISGTGKYQIHYNCDTPDVLNGAVTYGVLYQSDYEMIELSNNTFISWNLTGTSSMIYKIGITADVIAESYLVSDLNGNNALSIQEIEYFYPNIAKKYLSTQYHDDEKLLDPNDVNIKNTAQNIKNREDTENSFLLAKALFYWLKDKTTYKLHQGDGSVQPAGLTYVLRTGDCDDLSFLYISLCRAIGIPARFIRGYLLAEDKNLHMTATPHAWAEVFVGGGIGNDGWIPVECACCTASIEADINQNLGLESAYHLRLFVDDGTNESLSTSLAGISYEIYGSELNIDVDPIATVENYTELLSRKLEVTKDNQRSYQK